MKKIISYSVLVIGILVNIAAVSVARASDLKYSVAVSLPTKEDEAAKIVSSESPEFSKVLLNDPMLFDLIRMANSATKKMKPELFKTVQQMNEFYEKNSPHI